VAERAKTPRRASLFLRLADGACHILADLFVRLYREDGSKMVFIKPVAGFPGNQVYASNGEWAFDHNGWTREDELIVAMEAAYKERFSGWSCEKHIIEQSIMSLEEFCKTFSHQLPWQIAHLPWERAYNYIARFDSRPKNDALKWTLLGRMSQNAHQTIGQHPLN